MSLYATVRLHCYLVNYVMAFSICYRAIILYPRENEVILEVRKRRSGWPGFEAFVWRWLTSCWILSAMSPEIQEWSHKSRSRINNLYFTYTPCTNLLLQLIAVVWREHKRACCHQFQISRSKVKGERSKVEGQGQMSIEVNRLQGLL